MRPPPCRVIIGQLSKVGWLGIYRQAASWTPRRDDRERSGSSFSRNPHCRSLFATFESKSSSGIWSIGGEGRLCPLLASRPQFSQKHWATICTVRCCTSAWRACSAPWKHYNAARPYKTMPDAQPDQVVTRATRVFLRFALRRHG